MAGQKTAAEQALDANDAVDDTASEDVRSVAAQRRAAALGGKSDAQQTAEMIAALQNERRGYVQRDLKDRIAGVDAELERLGVKAAPRSRASTD